MEESQGHVYKFARIILQEVVMTREQKLRSILMQDTIFTKEFYTKFYEKFYALMQNPNKELDGMEVIDFRNEVANYLGRSPYIYNWSEEYDNKICLYENVIRCQMTRDEVEAIDTFWSAFAENPVEYIDDGLIGLIVDDLKIKDVKERKKKMRKFSEILASVTELDKMHYMKDGSLAYGKWLGENVYVRRLDNVPEMYGIDMNKQSQPIGQITKSYSGPGDPLITMWYTADFTATGEQGSVVFVFRLSAAKELEINEFLIEPVDYVYHGTYLIEASDAEDYNLYNTLAHIYVPFSDGPKGSKIPIMWRNDLRPQHFENGRLPWRGTTSFDDYTGDDGIVFNDDKFNDFVKLLSKSLASVDLETEPENRYAYIRTKLDDDLNTSNTPVFVYNRNHVAHHGAVANKEKMSPILFLLMTEYADSIYKEWLVDYCMRCFKETDNIVIKRKGMHKGQDEVVAMKENYLDNPTTSKVPEDNLHEDNILLRAAKASDIRYK